MLSAVVPCFCCARLGRRAVAALLVAARAARRADDNHATAFAAVFVGGHCECVVVWLPVVWRVLLLSSTIGTSRVKESVVDD